MVAPTAPPPFSDHNPSIPWGKVWQSKRDKGRRERERKEEIEKEIYRPLQKLTECCVNLLLIVHIHTNTSWTDGCGRLQKGGCGLPGNANRPQPIYPDDTGLFLSVCLLHESKQKWRSTL